MKFKFFVQDEKAVQFVDALAKAFEITCAVPEGVLFETELEDVAKLLGSMDGVERLYDAPTVNFTLSEGPDFKTNGSVTIVPLEHIQKEGREERICLFCEKPFMPKTKVSKFCSKKCMNALAYQKKRGEGMPRNKDERAEIAARAGLAVMEDLTPDPSPKGEGGEIVAKKTNGMPSREKIDANIERIVAKAKGQTVKQVGEGRLHLRGSRLG